jgi:transcriptional regulator with XRE-family HTH domain
MSTRSTVRRAARFTSDESSEWLRERMVHLGISGLQELQDRTGVDKGSISRYFRHERSPSIEVIAPLCIALEVSPETILIALGAIDRRSRS